MRCGSCETRAKPGAVFCLSDPPNRECEVGDIASTMRSASTNASKFRVILKLYPRRGSALAGLACGLPIVGYGKERSEGSRSSNR